MTSEHDDGPTGTEGAASESNSESGETPDAVSDAESPTKSRIDFVIDRLLEASRNGTVRRADAECIAQYCLGRVSIEGMCLFVVKEAISNLNDPSAVLFDLKMLLHMLDDDYDKIWQSFHSRLDKHVQKRREALMSRARSVIKAEIEASNDDTSLENTSTSKDTGINTESEASDEGGADPVKQAMQAEIEALKKQLEEKDKPSLEKAPSDDGSVGSKDLIDDGAGNTATAHQDGFEASAREENLKEEIVRDEKYDCLVAG